MEAHGTGTTLGDPIEAQALLATYGQDRAARPAAVAGVGEVEHRSHAGGGGCGRGDQDGAGDAARGAAADAARGRAVVACGLVGRVRWSCSPRPVPWPATGEPRRAGVSSFGISGTNAHVILEQAAAGPGLSAAGDAGDGAAGLDASAGGAVGGVGAVGGGVAGAGGAAGGFARRLRPGLGLADVGWSLATSRAVLEHRAVVLGADREELVAGLGAVAAGEPAARVVTGAAGQGGKLACVVHRVRVRSGLGMGRELYEAFPVFAAAFDAVCAGLDEHLGRPVAGGGVRRRRRGCWIRRCMRRRRCSRWRWRCSGCWSRGGWSPDVVAGHSVGELAAAHVAGVLSLDDACALVAARGRLMQALPAGGAMVRGGGVGGGGGRGAGRAVARWRIAAVNGPQVGGDLRCGRRRWRRWRRSWLRRGVRTRRLRVSHAFHSPLMEPMLEEFAAVAAGLSFARAADPAGVGA